MNRSELRRRYFEAWRRHRQSLPMEPLDLQIAEIIALHPEYHPILEHPDKSMERDWTPEHGETNPFLHLGMHLAIKEQVGTDRPRGIAGIHDDLCRRLGDVHRAEHLMMECLGKTMWEAQRSGHPPDDTAYLEELRSL